MNYDRNISRSTSYVGAIDQGLRSYMLNVYNIMALGLTVTGLTSLLISSSPALMMTLFGSPLAFLIMFAPIGIALFMQFRIQHLSVSAAQTTFWIYAALMGVSLSPLFLMYTGASITRVFFITAATFSGMSLYGYTTKNDLTRFGAFLFMGVLGLVIASVVNLFLHSTAIQFVTSLLGVVIFTGLTAYDTQTIKAMYYESDAADVSSKKAILGALQLYLDFINIFVSLLRLMGDRR